MTISPAARLTLGRLRYDTHVREVEVSLGALPATSLARAWLPKAVEVSAAQGDDAVLELTGVALADGADTLTVLTGTVCALRRGLDSTVAEVGDSGLRLAAFRPATTYSAGTAADVVSALVADAGATASRVEVDLPVATYVADQSRTAAEHVARLARLSGGVAVVEADGTVAAVPLPDQPDTALRHGRDLLEYDVRSRPLPAATTIAVGAGPAGSPQAPDALRPAATALPEGAPEPGPDAVWQAEPLLRTPSAASTASAALQARSAAASIRLRARCILLPYLRPGAVIEVQDLPEGPSGGPWLLTRVVHRIALDAPGSTEIEAVSAGGPGGLLGAARSAVGGLL